LWPEPEPDGGRGAGGPLLLPLLLLLPGTK